MNVAVSEIVWKTNSETIEKSNLARFAQKLGFDVTDYDSLYRWSVARSGEFWREAWEFSGLLGDLGARDTIDTPQMGQQHFFPDGKINVAENLLRHNHDALAVVEASASEDVRKRLTFGQLRTEVERVAAWLESVGVGEGDVVATWGTNRLEAVISFLATAAVGAIWTSASPDLSTQAVSDRLGQVNPVVLFASPCYTYNSTEYDITDRVEALRQSIPSIAHVVEFGQREGKSTLSRSLEWDSLQSDGSEFEYRRFPFNQPLLIMYTSGTTGKPKAIVHSGGGILIRNCAEHTFHNDLGPGDVFFWYTNIAWMMFHYLVLSLSSGSAIVLYDDAALRRTDAGPDSGVLWRVAAAAGVTTMGVSPGYLRTLQRTGYCPRNEHDLRSLRTFMATGAPVPPDLWTWCQNNISSEIRLGSLSGGTETLGAFVTVTPWHPFRPGEMSCNVLGIAADVFDERGVPVIGSKGELVITQPFPSMPLTFWGDGGDERYYNAYFAGHPGVWTHGDLAEKTIWGGIIIHGRSDNTLNPGGVRIGTAEIYHSLNEFDEIQDAVVFGRAIDQDEEVVLCLVMSEAVSLDEELAQRIRHVIRRRSSPRHVPASIYQVAEIPQTLNGKRNEAAAKAAVNGLDTQRFTSLANPQILGEYAAIRCMKGY
ncbi:acetoacetate--CoA ligase [Rhodococcus opacus]|uniref:acetoacetate--CoA ligase n=1 Tax=Rhodococcus opacus TaxID=37919 RepID=UPI002236C04F|nr:acetoacetate--CoA ligase [Rhodococcus opacus]UZG60319.1 acetoacetate--CoA ligase [Rhodococcus opacus]